MVYTGAAHSGGSDGDGTGEAVMAMLEDGFTPAVLARLAEQLESALPRTFAGRISLPLSCARTVYR